MATAAKRIALLIMLTAVCWPAGIRAEEAVVVFGSAVNPDGTPSGSLRRRLETALGVARRRPHAKVVVTGGTAAGPAEGPFMARWLANRGVKPDRLRVEARARHTGENAQLILPLLRQDRITTVTLVTGQSHMRRARSHLRWALRDNGLGGITVQCQAAPDGLGGLARMRAWGRESAKLVRDTAFHLRDRLANRLAGQAVTARAQR